MSSHISRLIAGMLIAAAALVLVTGCGGKKKAVAPATTGTTSTTSTTSTPTIALPAKNAKIAAEVPAKFKSKTLTVASDATYAPDEFIGSNGKTVVGWDPELMQALAAVMGVKANVVNATFATIIPGLQSGKYDIGLSSFGDTKVREKVVDFVTYFQAGASFYVNATGGPTINTLADLCGRTVSVETGTTELNDATGQDKKCKAAGKSGVKVSAFPDQNAANLAISSGRAQVGIADSPVAAYIVKQSNGKFKLVGKSYSVVPYGIALQKGSGLAKPLLDAVKQLIADGTYLKILTKWGVQGGAITNPKINGAIS
jgi:polar amino acid transport system substrate-binding protein